MKLRVFSTTTFYQNLDQEAIFLNRLYRKRDAVIQLSWSGEIWQSPNVLDPTNSIAID